MTNSVNTKQDHLQTLLVVLRALKLHSELVVFEEAPPSEDEINFLITGLEDYVNHAKTVANRYLSS